MTPEVLEKKMHVMKEESEKKSWRGTRVVVKLRRVVMVFMIIILRKMENGKVTASDRGVWKKSL